jgi:tetratricopeptide (TPR) repeat protein
MRRWVFAVLLLLANSSLAQFFGSDQTIHRLRLKLYFDFGACDTLTSVELVGRSGELAHQKVDESCVAQFIDVPAGSYAINVIGPGVVDASPKSIEPSMAMTEFSIQVRTKNELQRFSRSQACVPVADLAAPEKAARELHKANLLLAKNQLEKAKEHIEKALAIYPRYAMAYNNLAVVYARMRDRVHEAEALQTAIQIDDRFSAAYVNMARMNLASLDFAGAESALDKACSCDDGDPATLDMLAYAQYMNHHFDDALATSRRAHSRGGMHSTVHWVAERIFKLRRQFANATTEMETFLREEPTGNRAEEARRELTVLRASNP